MQIFLDALLAHALRPIQLLGKVDNTQAITAVNKCYFTKLRFLERRHKCSIGTINELINNNELRVEWGGGFTKCLTPAKFLAVRGMMSVVPNW